MKPFLPSLLGKDPWECVFVVMYFIACCGTDLEFADVKVIPSSVPERIDESDRLEVQKGSRFLGVILLHTNLVEKTKGVCSEGKKMQHFRRHC